MHPRLRWPGVSDVFRNYLVRGVAGGNSCCRKAAIRLAGQIRCGSRARWRSAPRGRCLRMMLGRSNKLDSCSGENPIIGITVWLPLRA